MATTTGSSDQTIDTATGLAAVARDVHAAERADQGGDSACWAHLVCPECGAISSDGHRQGCESEPVARSSTPAESDQPPTRADRLDPLSNEQASTYAERNLMRRIVIWTKIGMPVGAAFFGLLALVAARLSNSPAGPPVAMGAGVGVLAGVFFGMWTGVVMSVEETEHANLPLRPRPNAERLPVLGGE